MKRFFTTLATALLTVPVAFFALAGEGPGPSFVSRLDDILDDSDSPWKISLFALTDVNGDELADLVLASSDLSQMTVYAGGEKRPLKLKSIPEDKMKALRDRNETFYEPVSYLYFSLGAPEDDHLVALAPRFIWSARLGDNRFAFSTGEGADVDDAALKAYTKMVFKPHVGNVTYAGSEDSALEYYEQDKVWRMDDPIFVQTEFRGYTGDEVAPILFKDGFQQTVNLLQFSRWKHGEAVKAVSDDVKAIISDYYNGERVLGVRYVADCSANERVWYRVIFEPREGTGHYALVCIAEGSVASVWDEFDELEDPSDVWYGGNINDFWNWKEVEFMAMWGSPAGLEIAVRWPSREGIHYSILREYGSKMVFAYDDYQYIMAY